jgi:hypothetical protein
MRARAISLSAACLGLLASAFITVPTRAQSSPPSPPAEAVATPIGKVVSASGAVSIEHGAAVVVQANLPGSVGQTKVGDFVYKGDVVSTGPDGAVGIIFSDGTAFNLSSNARMALNEFVYDPNGKSNATLFSLTKGTFTFIAGRVARTGDMKIDTPVATMGIRGTTPHVEISADGRVQFSTLAEDKKAIDKAIGANGKKQRQTKVVAPPAATTGAAATSGTPPVAQNKKAENPPIKLDSSYDINVKICQGC